MDVREIMKQAIERGACSSSNKATDWKSLAWLFFTPQGLEFVRESRYPTIEVMREAGGEMRPYGFLVDAGRITRSNDNNVCVAGDTDATIVVTDPRALRHIVVMHGARATVVLRNYAVASITCVGGRYTIDSDATSKYIIER